MRINLVFYIVLLELVPLNILTIVLDLLEDNELIKYKVENIIN